MNRASAMYAASMLARYRVKSPVKSGATRNACSTTSAATASRSTGSGRLDADAMPGVWVTSRAYPRSIVRKPAGRVACRRSAALALMLAAVVACQPASPPVRSVDPNADVVVPYRVDGGGTIRLTVRPRYPVGSAVTLSLDVAAGAE